MSKPEVSNVALVVGLMTRIGEVVLEALRGDPVARARVEALLPERDPLRLELAQASARAEAEAKFAEGGR